MKVAVIGSGISGLVTSYLLKEEYQVTLFEKNSYLGGHTATKELSGAHQGVAVDTGFIVFNNRTYPNFLKFLARLGVDYQNTDMSFSVSNKDTQLEYNGHSLSTLFADWKNAFNPKFYRLLYDIMRFNKQARAAFDNHEIDPDLTLGDFLDLHNYNEYFRVNYLMSMGAAIWSSSIREMEEFPLLFFVRFFINHGLLDVTNRPQWYVVKGGSHQYVKAWQKECAEHVNIMSGAVSVTRDQHGVLVTTDSEQLQFDKVIFACHSDEALKLLGSNASPNEAQILGDIPYQNNEVVLHTDITRLPKHKRAWAAWNYMLDNKDSPLATLTYNMNILQGLKSDTTYCVSLNQTDQIDAEHIIGRYHYSHPVFNITSFEAQKKRDEINGQHNTYFCGAYWYNGFHEDGVRSALDVVKALNGASL
ncbi:NAD(P)/FAD-dependent oxidoreductase [Echinimonas agarilytica]|uniref:FAD-dependent oxidoreductase n=1 Tax=Echinimonas agarilytica TaxID=1215918 RepID=A0AA41W7A8_9GAMM|nr:FAD-dependent oxidoreductase [Echinimonas agarilytica]MCM2679996.1 FAD-dependent oxidoreductase [Echinimonas agarilytica]